MQMYRGMKNALLSIVLVFACAGCAHTKLVMKPSKIALGSEINPADGSLVDKKAKFSIDDEKAVAWVEFKNAYGSAHKARFSWVNPLKIVVMDSGLVPITPDEQLYDWRRVWSILPIRNTQAEFTPGNWKVHIYFDDKRIETIKFTIKAR